MSDALNSEGFMVRLAARPKLQWEYFVAEFVHFIFVGNVSYWVLASRWQQSKGQDILDQTFSIKRMCFFFIFLPSSYRMNALKCHSVVFFCMPYYFSCYFFAISSEINFQGLKYLILHILLQYVQGILTDAYVFLFVFFNRY